MIQKAEAGRIHTEMNLCRKSPIFVGAIWAATAAFYYQFPFSNNSFFFFFSSINQMIQFLFGIVSKAGNWKTCPQEDQGTTSFINVSLERIINKLRCCLHSHYALFHYTTRTKGVKKSVGKEEDKTTFCKNTEEFLQEHWALQNTTAFSCCSGLRAPTSHPCNRVRESRY